MSGTLYVVGTPIGNLGDLSGRAAAVLGKVDVVAAEDTRRTRQLLHHLGLHRPLVSLHQHNEAGRSPQLTDRLLGGQSIALVTDAGLPGISDPGAQFVRAARAAGVPVEVVPGPAAVTTALAGSGAPADRFVFDGFLPRRGPERRRRLAAIAAETRTVALYEAPQRLVATLADLAAVIGERPVTVARELTKIHEEFRTGTAAELAEAYSAGVRGEIVLIVHADADAAASAGRQDEGGAEADDWRAEARALVAAGSALRDVARTIAARHGLSRRAVYQALLTDTNNQPAR